MFDRDAVHEVELMITYVWCTYAVKNVRAHAAAVWVSGSPS